MCFLFSKSGNYCKNLYPYQGHNLKKLTATTTTKKSKKRKEKRKKTEEKVNVKYLNIKNIILMSN